MCSKESHIELSASEFGQVSWCKCCSTYSIIFKSTCASFDCRQMEEFKSVLENLKDSDFHFNVAGQELVLLKNQFANVGFCFNREDAGNVIQLIYEALTMHEAFKIIYD